MDTLKHKAQAEKWEMLLLKWKLFLICNSYLKGKKSERHYYKQLQDRILGLTTVNVDLGGAVAYTESKNTLCYSILDKGSLQAYIYQASQSDQYNHKENSNNVL